MGYLFYALLAVLSALIVAAEMATFSTRRDRLIALADEGDQRARWALVYLRTPRWYLAGSQWAMTLTSTIMGLMSSSLFSVPLQKRLVSGGMDAATAQTVAFWSATLGLTFLLTIFVNLLPKRIAYGYADATAMLFRSGRVVVDQSDRPVASVAQLDGRPLRLCHATSRDG